MKTATDQSDTYDVIVIGAGPTGENVADRTRAAGLSTLVVEKELVGGECSYWACVPSKAMLRPGAALGAVRSVAGARQAVTGGLDAAAVLARRDGFTGAGTDGGVKDRARDGGQVSWLESTGAHLVRGHARLDGPRRVAVDGSDGRRVFTARQAVAVCTGSRAVVPDLPGAGDIRPWTSREATSSTRVPGRLAIVGGGVVGVEMAAAWSSLGSRVTLLVRGDGLLPRMERFAGELVREGLEAAGVTVRTGVSVTEVREGSLDLDNGERLETDEILFATGRAPRTDDLGLETVGLKPGGWLSVDDTLRVREVPGGWLYCMGDTNHRALLTHQGKYQARVAGAAIAARAQGEPLDTEPWGAHAATADNDAVPQVVFTEPEAASVGLTAREAEERGLNVRAVDYDLGAVSGAALYADGYRGRARMVVDLDRECLVGATFVGPGAGELLHAATIAVAGEVPLHRLWHAVPAFPTVSEIWLRLLETYRG